MNGSARVADTRRDDPTRIYLSWKLATRYFRIWNKGQQSKYSIFFRMKLQRREIHLEAIVFGRVFISNGDAIFPLFIAFLYFIPCHNSYRHDSAKCTHGYSAGSSFPQTTNESRLIVSVQSYLIVINRAGRMLIVYSRGSLRFRIDSRT